MIGPTKKKILQQGIYFDRGQDREIRIVSISIFVPDSDGVIILTAFTSASSNFHRLVFDAGYLRLVPESLRISTTSFLPKQNKQKEQESTP